MSHQATPSSLDPSPTPRTLPHLLPSQTLHPPVPRRHNDPDINNLSPSYVTFAITLHPQLRTKTCKRKTTTPTIHRPTVHWSLTHPHLSKRIRASLSPNQHPHRNHQPHATSQTVNCALYLSDPHLTLQRTIQRHAATAAEPGPRPAAGGTRDLGTRSKF